MSLPQNLPPFHTGACYRVLAANKYKAQNRLEELKERIRQMKLKVDRHLKEQLKNAEVSQLAVNIGSVHLDFQLRYCLKCTEIEIAT